MGNIINGNLNAPFAAKTRGWFIGHFMGDNSLFRNEDFEVKWADHPKGEKSEISANRTSKTICILIKGKFVLKFPKDNKNDRDNKESKGKNDKDNKNDKGNKNDKDNKEVILTKQGDFAFWDAKVFHAYEALEDSVILTIRWPSIKNDQFEMP